MRLKIEGEIWKKVPDSLAPGNNTYVSNFGRVRSHCGIVTTPTPRKSGYTMLRSGHKSLSLHRVVLAAFDISAPSAAHKFVNHIDLNPSNNRLENLEWCTPEQNVQHSYANNTERGSCAHKKSKPVRGKRDGDDEWVTYTSACDAARKLGLTQQSISQSCRTGCKTQNCRFEFAEPDEPPVLPGEQWKEWGPVEISNLGRYKDCRGVVKTPKPCRNGYASVVIARKNILIHRLVAKLFLPPPAPGQTQVDHINGKGNEHWNLRWATPSENMKHSFADPNRKSGAPKKSKKIRCRKLGSKEWKVFPSEMEASRILGVSQSSIGWSCRKNASARVKPSLSKECNV